MATTTTATALTTAGPRPTVSRPTDPPPFRNAIGADARSGFYVVPRRYRLYLSRSCPTCRRIAHVHESLDLAACLPVTLLPPAPDAPDGGYVALRPLYEAAAHHYPGPAAPPVLADTWTGRIVSSHAPDILRDLTHRFARPCT